MSENAPRKLTLPSGQYIQIGIITKVPLLDGSEVILTISEIREISDEIVYIFASTKDGIDIFWKKLAYGVLTEYDVNDYFD